ncbi:heme-copper oxidase subunit III [Pedobacter sp. SD-b]|uniref:Heme-copper oxidase subunit III n=1 Tax=Pedobacter segetis TaxID=2793069 RepID=A0ABS1BFA7_9SPHI|nr:heme-copper oxidase subunit III [Pedobacter segetis]MBK0381541.1 heme-copper oxidase subunit III [Pedobacter segetis]
MENKLMMRLVIATEAILFISLMITYVYFDLSVGFTKQSINYLDIKSTGIFSVLLFSSSFTLVQAEKNYSEGKIKKLKIWLFATIVLGSVFLFGQAKEYFKLLNNHFNISLDVFSTNFFTLTGFHAFHVIIGLILLIIVFILTLAGDFDRPNSTALSSIGMYWHFVDIVWILVFTLVYVLPYLLK